MNTGVAGPDGSAFSEELGTSARARCWCLACEPQTVFSARFVVCPVCGDKRCLHANNHAAPCAKTDIYAHNAWVERMALRAAPSSGHLMPQLDAVIALGAWEVPNAELRGAKPIGEASRSNDVLGADAPERN